MIETAALAAARERLASERARLARASAPRVRPPIGTTWRPTPSRFENDTTARTVIDIVMRKVWSGAPIDPAAFDPTPGPLPGPPPVNTVPPNIMVVSGSLSPGGTLGVVLGTWSNAPTSYTRQWNRDGRPIAGEVAPGYAILDSDVGSLLGCSVTAVNPNGVGRADAAPVGPILPATRR
jgi:hypothetical protein